MKKPFIHQDFLLQNEFAKKLYHEYASEQPIIDYHCHLPPDELAGDKNFKTLTNIWLDGDHYKWRAMRACGVDEKYITGDASDKEKFMAWAETVPKTLKNPLFHWTHMELNNPFGINDRLLNGETAESIWEECNEMLQTPEFSTQGILKKNNVKVVGTTDDPTDSMEFHQQLVGEDTDFKMVPTFRPDRGMDVGNSDAFQKWVAKLGEVAEMEITNFDDFLEALDKRHAFFHELGARASDHGLDELSFEPFTNTKVSSIFKKVMSGQVLDEHQIKVFKSAFLYHCGVMDYSRGWVFQMHIGPIRNNNSRMMRQLGRDAGFDSIGDYEIARPLSRTLDSLDNEGKLPKTILYNSNPRDNEMFATMIGNFQDGSVAGKMQYGPSWWFLDQKEGIEAQILALSNMGILSEFIGMTTDSRSFLSYPRHDYFRRILCNMLGTDVEAGLLPEDIQLLGDLVKKISYTNARSYFGFEIAD